MNLFLDTSVGLAASGSQLGASLAIFEYALIHHWTLQTSSYVLGEVAANLCSLGPNAHQIWPDLRAKLQVVQDVVGFEWPVLFAPAKDRPILFTAAAWSDVLLTLDRRDFGPLLDCGFYGLQIMTPGSFLKRERDAGRLSTDLKRDPTP